MGDEKLCTTLKAAALIGLVENDTALLQRTLCFAGLFAGGDAANIARQKKPPAR